MDFRPLTEGAEDDAANATRLSFSARYQISDTLVLGGALFRQDTVQEYDGYSAFSLGDLIGYSQDRSETGARVFAEITAGNTLHLFDISALAIARTFDEVGTLKSYDATRLTLAWQGTTEISDQFSLIYGLDWSRERAEYADLPGGSAEAAIYGAFAQGIWAPSEALDISATLRTDRNSGFGSFPTGRLAMSFRPADGTTLHAAFATGFRAPSLDERFGDYPGFFPFIGNPALLPEESQSFEIGVEQSFASEASFGVTLFQLDIDNLVTYQFVPSPGVSTLVNLPGTSTRKGVEVAGNLPLGDALTFGLAYSYTDARSDAGARIARVPYHNLSVTLDADLSDRLAAGLALTYVAGRIDNDPNTFAIVAMPDYTVLNARMTYDLNETTAVYLKVENLLDTDYQEVNGFATPGRSVYLGLQAKF